MRTFFLLLFFTAHLCAQQFNDVTSARKHFIVCRIDLSKRQLHLFLRDDSGTPFKTFDALDNWLHARNQKLTFAMNAGMYERDFSPAGLFVENAKELSPVNLKSGEGNFYLRPNGIFAITHEGARIIESSAFPSIRKTTLLATQSGPMLVMDDRIHPAFKADSASLLFRNGVGVVSPHEVVFAISEEPVNFHEFARFFRDELHCKGALFLDGTISSLYSRELKRNDRKMDLGPIIATVDDL